MDKGSLERWQVIEDEFLNSDLNDAAFCKLRYPLLHRGEYNNGESMENKSPWTWSNVYSKLIGIDDEYTTGDKIIAWSVFGYAVIAFLGVLLWNWISPWPVEWWSWYFFITVVVVGIIVGSISTVWFMIGGIIDMRRLFGDLSKRVDNPLDDGWGEGHVSLVDIEKFGKDKNNSVNPEI